MRKTICILLALVMSMSFLAGCASDKDTFLIEKDVTDGSENTKLTYFGYKSDTLNVLAIENAIHSFEEKHQGVTITYEGLKGTAYWEALEKRNDTNNLDDIFMVDHDRSLVLRSQNKLEDLSDLITDAEFVPTAVSQFTNDDGTVDFLPMAIISFGLYCNLDMLAADGFTPPTNYSELASICDYYVSKGITPIIGNNYSMFRTLVLSKSMYDVYKNNDYNETIAKINSGELDLSEILRPGLDMVEEMLTKKWLDGAEVAATSQTSDDLVLFKTGDRPFMITGTWASPRVVGEGGVGFEYAIYPYPVLDDGSVLVMDIATCISINAAGENKDAAKQFVRHMIEPDVIWEYCDSQSSFSPILGDDRLPSDPALIPQIPYLSNGRSVIGSNYNITLPLDNALHEVGLDMMEGATASEAAAKLKTLLYQ